VLRRVAAHLYGIGRHLERAEWRARLVDVNYHLLIESPPHAAEPWEPLLAITGQRDAFDTRHEVVDEDSVLDFFIFDERNPASIRSCLMAARESARELRHRISSELWLELNTLYLEAQQWRREDLATRGVFAFFSDLRDRFYRLSGVIDGTLPRDLGFDFVVLGRALEGIESVARLLDVKYHYLLPNLEDVGGSIDLLQWAAVLRSASALEAYRRTHGTVLRVDHVVDILLFDGTFPRSAYFAAERLAGALSRVAGSGRGRDVVPGAGLLLDALDHASADAVIAAGLHDYLLAVEEACVGIGRTIAEQYLAFA